MRLNPKSHSQYEQANIIKNNEEDLPPPMENIQENFRRVSTRQQNYREFRNNVQSSPQQIDLYSETQLRKVTFYEDFQLQKIGQVKIDQELYYVCYCFWYLPKKWNSCDTPISTWLIVIGITFGLDSFLYFVQMMITYIEEQEAKFSISLISLGQFCLISNFQVAWLIYGNTFHYNSDSIRCKDNDDDFRSMWILMMIQIAVGYIIFFLYSLLACCCLCAVCILCRGGAGQNYELVGKIPYMNAIKSLNKKDFKSIEEKNKNMIDCSICLNKFKDDDEITELNCDKRHYFHTECIQTWMQRKLECPLCKKPVQPVARI
ncbi:zinc finger protein [Stylonychia lemnae]|uniref:Zinc finger protein n=1 Tax=Stylonychia lemnae TaxID=5949 RepID=A0A077ZWG5_STYLE|nr:zinc finger protein [Stylonychia lemnae]|eukprot:CDW72786.1 zinc finger protein [Stylonychia lemnae]